MLNPLAIVNLSPDLSGYQTALIGWAIGWQLRRDFAPAWNKLPRPVVVYTNEAYVPDDAYLITILQSASVAGALGFHDLTPLGRPYGRVFTQPILESGGTVLSGNNSISATTSHECCEADLDENCNLWADGPNGNSYALESSDGVEDTGYNMVYGNISVSVSNFQMPEWFNQTPPPGAQFDFLRLCSGPFELLSGGYSIIENNGQTSQITARTGKVSLARHNPDHPASRTFKRLHRQKGISSSTAAGAAL